VKKFGTVVPLVSARALSGREFTYELPEGVGKGAVVSVPFGRSRARGVVVDVVDAPPQGVKALPVEKIVHELPETLVDLALWLAEYYGSTPARALELVAPVRRARRKEQAPPGERQSLEGEAAPERLSDPQVAAVSTVVGAMDSGGGHFLLYGATGSGKTEVYLQAAAAALERGLGTIVLVPEIALAPQTVGRFRARFGDRVAILHSGLTDAERRDERERIASGEARVVVGARSAIFAPMRGVGLVCVDEEHDASYKQESDPRYDARTVAAKRAALEGAVALYGSATPRPESWERLERLNLGERLGGGLAPGRARSADEGRHQRPGLDDRRRRRCDRRGRKTALRQGQGDPRTPHPRRCRPRPRHVAGERRAHSGRLHRPRRRDRKRKRHERLSPSLARHRPHTGCTMTRGGSAPRQLRRTGYAVGSSGSRVLPMIRVWLLRHSQLDL